jgi:hypothetical protein
VSFFIENKPTQFENTPAGLHLSRCYRIIDLGTQRTEYKGQVKYLRKIKISWEIHGFDEDGKPLLMKDGRPYSIYKDYTYSWKDTSNLMIDLKAWRNNRPFTKEELVIFDLENILGAWCMLNVIHTVSESGNTYAKVQGITSVPPQIKQQGYPEPVNENLAFSLNEPNMDVFEKLHDKLKETIKSSPEWEEAKNNGMTTPKLSEDPNEVPF